MKNLHYLSFVIVSATIINAEEHLTCPIGFNLAYDETDSRYICYHQKRPETFQDKYKKCHGNLYTLDLYERLNITKTKSKLWTDYTSLYPGGPFVNWKYGEDEPEIIFNISNKSTVDNSKKLCLIRDDDDYVAVDCEEKHDRYCFVKAYSAKSDWEHCDEFKPSYKLYSPEELCLMNITIHPGLTPLEAKDLCESKHSSLLSKGWIYTNIPLFNNSFIYPLHKKSNDIEESHAIVDILEKSVDDPDDDKSNWRANNTRLMAIQNGVTQFVDENYMFSDILCEKTLNHILTLDLSINLKNQIILRTSNKVDESDIYCFTDSMAYHPTKIKINYVIDENIYLLSPIDDGYYWCYHIHLKTMKKSLSNEVLYINEGHSLWHLYAVKLHVNEYTIENLNAMTLYWKQKLAEYLLDYAKYYRRNDQKFGITRNNKELNMAESDNVVKTFKIKRLFLDKRTVLVHIDLNPDMIPLSSGAWDDIEVVYMRPVYSVGKLDDNQNCSGNFNEGILCDDSETKNPSELDVNEGFINDGIQEQIIRVESKADLTKEGCIDCELNLMYTLEIEDSTTEISVVKPEDLVNQILEDLEQLLQDDSAPIMIEDINETFDQVNSLLDGNQDVVFPGGLLQLLEQVGERVDINGSLTASLVGENIAMLLADAGPDNPVLGITVADRATDEFAEDSFAFYTESQDELSANNTEAAVFLPPSLTALRRRISFIVYRNDRAFSDPRGVYAVNSRVISVNVANFTGFQSGEVVNIHTRPRIPDPGRNITRGCAYWRFQEDDTGFWSQDGCTFIGSRDPGLLDICRCDHLTHFAEILIPRPVFSQTNEDILEILSVVGCSISILGLLVIIITSILFQSWRKSFRNQIWLQLCISLFVMMICFIIVVFADFERYDVPCMLIGIIMHYTLLAAFCWMLVVAIKSYRDLVLIFAKPVTHKVLVASSFSWGLPVVIVGILLIADPLSYFQRFEEKNPSSNFCYPSGLGLWLSVYAPVSAVLLANIVLFVLIARKIGVAPKNLRYQRAGDKREALNCARISFVLVFFFGLPWFFGLFAYNVVAAYFFTCTATLQGFVLFVFIVLGNYETRNLWLLKLRPNNIIMNKRLSSRSVTMLS